MRRTYSFWEHSGIAEKWSVICILYISSFFMFKIVCIFCFHPVVILSYSIYSKALLYLICINTYVPRSMKEQEYFTIQFTFRISLSSYFALVVCDCALVIITFLPTKQSFFISISRISSKPVALCLNQVALHRYASRQLHLVLGRLNL